MGNAHVNGGFRLVPMTIRHCEEICGWTYEPPYDIYAWRPWDRMLAENEEFADEEIRNAQYASVLDAQGQLAGFAQFFPILGVTRLGLGMRPDRCGLGEGASFVRAIVHEACRRAPQNEIDLEVLVWNERARRTYERAGFCITDRYERPTPRGPGDFYCMVYRKEPYRAAVRGGRQSARR